MSGNHAKAKETIIHFLRELFSLLGDADISVKITGSIGMGISEKCSLPFVQEVVSATKAIQQGYPHVGSMIDIGGEDAKVVFFKDAEAIDLRMNGNCAGGTGAFIDQMAGDSGGECRGVESACPKCYPGVPDCLPLRSVL